MDDRRGPLWPLLTMLSAIGVMFFVFWLLADESGTWYDRIILDGLAGAFTIYCLVMLWRTRYWDWLALAILAAFMGDSQLYGLLARWIPDWWRNNWNYLIRATFVVAAIMLISQLAYDLIVWIRDRRRLRNNEMPGESS